MGIHCKKHFFGNFGTQSVVLATNRVRRPVPLSRMSIKLYQETKFSGLWVVGEGMTFFSAWIKKQQPFAGVIQLVKLVALLLSHKPTDGIFSLFFWGGTRAHK